MKIEKKNYNLIIKKVLKEDLSNIGDVTSMPIFHKKTISKYKLLSKDKGILCGREVFSETFNIVDKKCNVKFFFNDCDKLKKGDVVAIIEGRILSILKAERTALNFISHLSGIATKTFKFTKKADGNFKILDTRKTTPGLRILQKYAVSCGGGHNHRKGLYDMVLIKDNHIDSVGGIIKAVDMVKKKWKDKYKIEVEARNLDEVNEALCCNVDRIMLDNMSIDTIKKAVKIINNEVEIEVSGNITLKSINKIVSLGIDYVSIGELTHTVKNFDFSLVKEDHCG